MCSCCDFSDSKTIPDQDSVSELSEYSELIPVLEPWPHTVNYCDIVPPAWYDEYIPPVLNKHRTRNIISVNRDNRKVEGLSLPIISVSNCRSLTPKLNNFKNDIIQRGISVSLCSEVWEKANCKKQRFEFEKMFHMEGLKYISTPRTTKRGGGAAIIVNIENFTLDKLEIIIPYKLEVIWGLMRPKIASPKIREIIVCSFYSPPKSKKNSKLLDHLISTTQFLLTKYPNAGIIMGGDKNDLNLAPLMRGVPRLKNIVTKNTYKNKILDVILTNMHALYSVPMIVPPVPPDDPMCGAPSDHNTAVATPLAQDSAGQTRDYVIKTYRPLPESGILEFGEWICSEDWLNIPDELNPTEQVCALENLVNEKLDSIFPLKSVKVNPNMDKPFITAELKKLNRQLKREYRKNQKSAKYRRLKHCYDEKFKKAAEAYLVKNVRSLKEDDAGKAYQSLKKLGAQPGDCSDEGAFTLISHIDDNLTTEESIEKIAEHFSKISQEFKPLNINLLPESVQVKINAKTREEELPDILDYDVYNKIKKTKKPKSGVPGDLPRRLVQEFAPELAAPLGKIIRNIVQTRVWPKSWRVEYGTPLQKISNPINEDDLRIISLTSFLSKVSEQFVISWLLQYVGEKIDWGQYGGTKGSSISHFLIELVNFVLFNHDLNIPHSVLAVFIDFSKVFNKINHNLIIKILSDMGVPGWLLKIVMGFLTDRELILRYKGGCSSRKALPGGSPQGTRLGLLLFLILINAVGYQDQDLVKNMGERITQNLRKRKPLPNTHMKYVDDLSLVQSLNLREALIPNPAPNPPRPLAYHDRTNHILPIESIALQGELNKLERYCQEYQMSINQNKCKVMIFNPHRAYAGMPKLTLSGMRGNFIEVVETFKLLGVKIRSDLKWWDNTDYICQKGYKRLWVLRRLKILGASEKELLDVYQKQVRSVLELAVPVWQPALTTQEKKQIERVQKCALNIILGSNYIDYKHALNQLECENLEERRMKLCEKFARKASKNLKYQNWFCRDLHEPAARYTRTKNKKVNGNSYQ